MRAILALLLLLLATSPVQAEPMVSDFQVGLEGQRVLASLRLRDAMDRRFRERIDSGLPTDILYRFELQGDRKRWFDDRLKTATLEVVARHDAVARAYTVHFKLDGELIDSRTLRDRKELEEAMTRIDRLPVFRLDGIRSGRRLLVKARAELGTRLFLSFVPVAVVTDWTESGKFRSP